MSEFLTIDGQNEQVQLAPTRGMMSCGKCVTAKISEFLNQENECILSDIIERNVEVKYYLSLKQIQKLLYKGYQAKKENAYIQLMGLALL